MAEVDINKKPWSIPDIYSLSFKKTEGGTVWDDYEDCDREDCTYNPDYSGGH